jgi:branched-chain amino acid aminotransferase
MVTVVWEKDKGWHSATVEPYGPIMMDPSAAVLHYGQEIFEGIKAYRHKDGSIWTFRPTANAARLQKSAHRMALPELPTEIFVESLQKLLEVDAAWVPQPVNEKTLYIRPFEIAAENFLGVRAAQRAEYRVIASPVGPYFTGGIKPVSIWIALDSARAGKHGTGEAKTGGNYAASLLAQGEGYEQGCSQVMFLDAETATYIEELGGMNLFFVYKDGHVATPSLDGTILRGITRDSVVTLLRDRGHKVEERKITLDEVRAGIESGEITEVFACGTAAVITPVGQFKSREGNIGRENAEPGELTVSLRNELTGIQYGTVEDRHGWMHKLVD